MGQRQFIGVDLYNSVIQACVLDARGDVAAVLRRRYSSREEGLELVAELKAWGQAGRLAVEALGLNRWFVDACREGGPYAAWPSIAALSRVRRKT